MLQRTTYRSMEAMVRRPIVAVLVAWLLFATAGSVTAQSDASDGGALIRVETDTDAPPALIWSHPDSVRSMTAELVDSLRAVGYFFAEVDTSSSTYPPAGIRTAGVLVRRGPLIRLESVLLTGVAPERAQRLRSVMRSEPGAAFDVEGLEADVERMLIRLEREGLPLAGARIETIERVGPSVERLAVRIAIVPGPSVPLVRLDLAGADRTSVELVARLAELEIGRPLTSFEPDQIRSRLEESGLFEVVGQPELVIEADTTAVIRIAIEEGDPGSFDLMLGYLPARTTGRRGSIVGSGHLNLRNLFGRGRTLSLRLHRLPGQVSRADAEVSDPYVFGLPVGLGAAFHGLEQDSTYGKQTYRGEVRVHLAPGVDILGGFSRELTGPGQAGLRLTSPGRQVVPKSDAWFFGIGTRISSVDRPLNPTRGFFVEMNLESGRKQRTERRVREADTTRQTTLLEQKRLRASGRYIIPAFTRQVVVVGADAGILLSNEFDRSDLFRIGGATSLRGYDEERFLGAVVGRGLIEYRFLIDPRSFAYAFLDVGYVERPDTPDTVPSRDVHAGYGLGIQFDTAVGLMNVSAALNPDSGPTEARIHAGLSFGL